MANRFPSLENIRRIDKWNCKAFIIGIYKDVFCNRGYIQKYGYRSGISERVIGPLL